MIQYAVDIHDIKLHLLPICWEHRCVHLGFSREIAGSKVRDITEKITAQ